MKKRKVRVRNMKKIIIIEKIGGKGRERVYLVYQIGKSEASNWKEKWETWSKLGKLGHNLR